MSSQAEATTDHFCVDSGDVELAVTDWGGDGSDLLLSHATGFCAGVWNTLAASIAASTVGRHRVFGFDQRAHGDSSKPAEPADLAWEHLGRDVLAVLDGMGIDHTDAIGHSSGAAALVLAAAAAPGRFTKLVLFEPIIAPPLPPGADKLLDGPNPLVEGALRRRMVFDDRADMLARFVEKPPFDSWDARVLADYVEHGSRDEPGEGRILKCPGELEAEMYRQGPRHGGYDALPDIDAEVLVVGTDSASSPFPVEWWQHLAERIPHARFEVIEGHGHFAPMEDPDGFAKICTRFLDS